MSAKIILLSSLIFLIIGLCDCNVNSEEPEWWESTQIYQIWTRGFKDSDGDGEGDLQGILSELDYLKDIGVETICLNPIFLSPLIDFGYDISNYTDIDPIYGDLEDFDQLIEEAHEQDIKIILNIVPSHSSIEHEWFEASVNRIAPYSDYYIWANGSVDENGTRVPPNNWASVWNYTKGSAWTWNEDRDQWYYHKFKDTEPNLNLRNKDVVEEILDILDFWLDRGVDGFQISKGGFFYEDLDLEDDSDESNESDDSNESDESVDDFGDDEYANFLYKIREFTDNWTEENNSTSKLLLVESEESDANLISYYGDNNRSGVVPFNFHLITNVTIDDGADDIKILIENWLDDIPENSTTNWPISHPDGSRIATRQGQDRLEAWMVLTMLLPGQAYSYYGDEIGMTDAAEVPGYLKTINPTLNNLADLSKYAAKSPMQWDNSTSAGFSVNETLYFPINEDYVTRNVESQLEDSLSTLNTYKSLAHLRKDPVFHHGNFSIETINNDKVIFLKRHLENHPDYLVLINFGAEEEIVNITSLVSDDEDDDDDDDDNFVVVFSTNEENLYEVNSTVETVVIEPSDAVVLRNYINETDANSPEDDSSQENSDLKPTPYSLGVGVIDSTPANLAVTTEELDDDEEETLDISSEIIPESTASVGGTALIINPIITLLSICCILLLFK
ncbi:GSCOCG00006628001-RA-CDS [Cotesia congregata]|uniref:alpha-glucosidase n=1 Tax=Cotesia congregata TaxID=51543 RepID=A0A8J2HQ63_COTCN|nr:GSCOCG00006628001-RA-CDS [Cotesia congregata]CAG5106167.1 Similar to Mal-B2: Maltase 2 (Drosophila virilis) [Cotesia congregata]